MPLNPKSSMSEMISELMNSYKEKGSIGTSKPKSKKAAIKQSLAIAYKTKGMK